MYPLVKRGIRLKKAVTIYRIAEEAGVSPATVSRVLTGNSRVSPDKLERVRKLIAKYDFSPNAMAKGLSESRSKTIGMISADISNPFYSALFLACEREAYNRQYNLSLYSTFSEVAFELSNLEKLRQQRAEAIIICGGQIDQIHPSPEVEQEIRRMAKIVPVILTSESTYGSSHTVAIDQAKAMGEALDYLLALGHRHIVHMAGHPNVISTGIKNKVFFEKMHGAGGILDENSIVNPAVSQYYSFESGVETMREILNRENRPTAVICTNDICAAGALRAITEQGLQAPRDISILGFDDTFISDITTPKITTVGYDYEAYAKMLVNTAIGYIENTEVETGLQVIPKLVIKESCKRI